MEICFNWSKKRNVKKEMKDCHTDDQKSNKTSIIYFRKMGSKLFDYCLDSLGKRILNDIKKQNANSDGEKGHCLRREWLINQKKLYFQ